MSHPLFGGRPKPLTARELERNKPGADAFALRTQDSIAKAYEKLRGNLDIVRPTVILRAALGKQSVSEFNVRSDLPAITDWANAADHTQDYGPSDLGYFAWGINLFPSYDIGIGGALPSDHVYNLVGFVFTVTIQLLDATGAVLTTSTFTQNYQQVGPEASYTTDRDFAVVNGSEQITAFNAVRFSAGLVGTPNDPTPVPGGSIYAITSDTALTYFRGVPIDA
jgi:hypothetical protein